MDHIRAQWQRLAARDDVHSIARFNPADYQYKGFFDLNEIEDIRNAVHSASQPSWAGGGNFYDAGDPRLLDIFDAMQRTIATQGWHGRWFERGGCDHCGAPNLRYVNSYVHTPTGDIIVVGSTCSGKAGLANRNDYELAAAKQREETRKANAIREAKRTKWRAENPEDAAVLDLISAACDAGKGNGFWISVLKGVKNYGAPTDSQMRALRKSWAEAEAKEIEEKAPPIQTVSIPCPTGAQTIQGTILSIKWQSSQYGDVEKCLVLDHRGFKVWGSVPGRANWEKGDEVRFVATIEQSDDDPTFGFFKRPRLMEERDESGHWQKVAGMLDGDPDEYRQIEADMPLTEVDPDPNDRDTSLNDLSRLGVVDAICARCGAPCGLLEGDHAESTSDVDMGFPVYLGKQGRVYCESCVYTWESDHPGRTVT